MSLNPLAGLDVSQVEDMRKQPSTLADLPEDADEAASEPEEEEKEPEESGEQS